MPKPIIGDSFKLGKTTYVINAIQPINPDTNRRLITVLVLNDESINVYVASMILRSGKISSKDTKFYWNHKNNTFRRIL